MIQSRARTGSSRTQPAVLLTALLLTVALAAGQLFSAALLASPADAAPAPSPAPAPSAPLPGTLRFNQPRYSLPGCVSVRLVYTGPTAPVLDVQSMATHDSV